jgi:adenylate kinase
LLEKKYIFDGYPRNISQAMTLNDEILEGHDYTAVYFNVDTEKLVKRLTNRRVSADGKHIYNLLTNPPEVDGICNFTGQTLVHRDDDREEVIRQRMEVFKSTVQPMIDYYKEKGNLCVLEADRTVDEVFTELKNL